MPPRLRVLHLYKDAYPPIPGGVEKHIDGLRRAMHDVESHVLVCARSPRTSTSVGPRGVEVRVAELGPRWLAVPVAPTFPLWVRRLEADLIHVHMPNPLGEGAALLAAAGRPIVASYHADVVRQARFMWAYRPLLRSLLDRAAMIVVGTRSLLETSEALAGSRDRARVIPYGIDLERFRPDAVPAQHAAELRARLGTPLVLAIARLVHYKGLDHLIEAARGLEASVVVVGTGPLERRLRALAASAGNVRLVGAVGEEELVRYLRAADCFVLSSTSRAESFGVATVEAQAMGVPAVVTDVGTGTVEAIEPGRTGLVVPPGDPGALAEAIRSILSDPKRAEAMGRAARERAVERHGLQDQALRMRRVYDEALSARR